MKSPENAGPSTAVDVQTAAVQVNEVGMPKIPCVMTEPAEILLRVEMWKT